MGSDEPPPPGVKNVKIMENSEKKTGDPRRSLRDLLQPFLGPKQIFGALLAPKRSKYGEICLKGEWKIYIFRHFSAPKACLAMALGPLTPLAAALGPLASLAAALGPLAWLT